MNVVKAGVAVFLILLLAFSMLAVISYLKQDQSQDDGFYVTQYGSVNRSVNLTETMMNTGAMFITPTTLIVAILFLAAAVLIFRRI